MLLPPPLQHYSPISGWAEAEARADGATEFDLCVAPTGMTRSHGGIHMPGITETPEIAAGSLAHPKHPELRTAVAGFAMPKRSASAWQARNLAGVPCPRSV